MGGGVPGDMASGWVRRAAVGGAAGLGAAVVMSLFMGLARRALPPEERGPLPPRTVTKNLLRAAGRPIDDAPNPDQASAALVAHLGYGAALGALYGPLAGATRLAPAAEGLGYGLLAWAVNYPLLLPAVGLIAPVDRETPRRTALMVAANGLFGAVLGLFTRALDGRSIRR